MKRLLFALFCLVSLTSVAFADKNTVILHPGDTIFARFEVNGNKLRLTQATKEKNESAQVVIFFNAKVENGLHEVTVENKLARDLAYKIEMRSISLNHQMRGRPTPVVAGKMAFDTYPAGVEELALFDFKFAD